MIKKDMYGTKKTIRAIEGIFEIAILAVVYYLVWRNGYDAGIFPNYYGKGKYALIGVYVLITLALYSSFDGFKFGYLRLTDTILSQWIALFITNVITYGQLCLIANKLVTPVPMLVLMVADMVISFVCCYCYSKLYHRLYVPKNMLMIFGTKSSLSLKFKMDTRRDKYRISKLIPEHAGFKKICEEIPQYDAVIINDLSAQIRNDILKYCYQNQIRTYITPKISDVILSGGQNISLFDTPLIMINGKGLTPTQRFVKRLMDIVISAIALLIAAPFMLIVAIAIKIEDGGPVFFIQKRATLGGKEFDILKFRSMIVDAEKEGFSIPATGRDPRITKVGHVIRATRLDELPQLLNILKGDMSVVGPRPERLEHVMKYSEEVPEFAYRLKVKGGLTGYAQIYGKYNTTPYDKLRLDLMYIEHYSIIMDIKLLLTTIRIMLKKESTEGFDKLEELERMKEEALAQVYSEENELEKIGAGK